MLDQCIFNSFLANASLLCLAVVPFQSILFKYELNGCWVNLMIKRPQGQISEKSQTSCCNAHLLSSQKNA